MKLTKKVMCGLAVMGLMLFAFGSLVAARALAWGVFFPVALVTVWQFAFFYVVKADTKVIFAPFVVMKLWNEYGVHSKATRVLLDGGIRATGRCTGSVTCRYRPVPPWQVPASGGLAR